MPFWNLQAPQSNALHFASLAYCVLVTCVLTLTGAKTHRELYASATSKQSERKKEGRPSSPSFALNRLEPKSALSTSFSSSATGDAADFAECGFLHIGVLSVPTLPFPPSDKAKAARKAINPI